jgi:hypothetical protein
VLQALYSCTSGLEAKKRGFASTSLLYALKHLNRSPCEKDLLLLAQDILLKTENPELTILKQQNNSDDITIKNPSETTQVQKTMFENDDVSKEVQKQTTTIANNKSVGNVNRNIHYRSENNQRNRTHDLHSTPRMSKEQHWQQQQQQMYLQHQQYLQHQHQQNYFQQYLAQQHQQMIQQHFIQQLLQQTQQQSMTFSGYDVTAPTASGPFAQPLSSNMWPSLEASTIAKPSDVASESKSTSTSHNADISNMNPFNSTLWNQSQSSYTFPSGTSNMQGDTNIFPNQVPLLPQQNQAGGNIQGVNILPFPNNAQQAFWNEYMRWQQQQQTMSNTTEKNENGTNMQPQHVYSTSSSVALARNKNPSDNQEKKE